MAPLELAAHPLAMHQLAATMTNQTRFEQIYHNYSGLILAYAARRTDSSDEAADIVAETFAVAWRRIGDVPPGEEARPWLYGVARRVLANQRRSSARRIRLDEKLRVTAIGLVQDPADATGDGDVTRAALQRLSEEDRELLTLSAWDGLDGKALAVVLGCTPATARVRLHRARRRFERNLLLDRGNE